MPLDGERRTPPDRHAGALVKSQKAAGAASLIAPAGIQNAHDDQVAIHDGAVDAAAEAGNAAIFFGQGMRPEDLTVLVETKVESLNAVGVDVAGFGIAGQVAPADAIAGNVGLEDVEAILPKRLAGVLVKTHNAFLIVHAAAGLVDDVDAPVHDDGAAAAAVGLLPDDIAVGVGWIQPHVLGQVLVVRDPRVFRPPPVGPIVGLCGRALEHHQSDTSESETLHHL